MSSHSFESQHPKSSRSITEITVEMYDKDMLTNELIGSTTVSLQESKATPGNPVCLLFIYLLTLLKKFFLKHLGGFLNQLFLYFNF